MKRSLVLLAISLILVVPPTSGQKSRRVRKPRHEQVDNDHTPSKKIKKKRTTCNGFFTVLAEKEPWRTKGKEPCADTFGKQDPFFRILSAQMQDMDATLTVFTTYRPDADVAKTCSFDYPNIELKYFDATALMAEYDLSEVILFLSQFSLMEYTRTSDILRLLLAHKHSLTYIDPDVHFLDCDKAKFMREFVGAAVWNEVQCSLEISNCAFCLSEEPLESLIAFLKHRILHGDTSYLYAELGPAMFQKVLMNNYAVTLYSQNNPEQEVVSDVVAGIKKYNHSMLHVTSTIRLFLIENNRENEGDVISFLSAVRREAGLKPLTLPVANRNAEDTLFQYKAFVRNNFHDPKGFQAASQFTDVVISVLSSYLELSNGKVTAENVWVRQLTPANSKENLYLECMALLQYIEQSTNPASSEHQQAKNMIKTVKDRFSPMLDQKKLSSVRIPPIGAANPAVSESQGKKKRRRRRKGTEL